MSRLLASATLTLATLLLSTGCSASVIQGQPRPNIDLPNEGASLALVIDESVKDQFDTDINGQATIHVFEWRTTLKNGFHAGFDSAFRTSSDKADLTLQLSEVMLGFAPTAVSQKGITAAEAQVRYKARLLDAQGQVVRRSNGTVTSKRSATRGDDITNISADAVESMYEKIAQDFFSQPLAPTPSATPAQ